MSANTDEIDGLHEAILEGRHRSAPEFVQQALDAGFTPDEVLEDGMVDAMAEVGRRFETNECFVPEMLLAARAMQAGLEVLKPHLAQGAVQVAGRVVIGAVRGDMHDIGKNLVGMMLEGAGFEVVDLGTDVTAERFVGAVLSGDVDIVAMSALLTTTLPQLQATIHALDSAGVREQVKVLVGGAPVTATFARRIGADGYAPDASRAVAVARELQRK